jgi:hypothetical protein
MGPFLCWMDWDFEKGRSESVGLSLRGAPWMHFGVAVVPRI